VGAGIAFVVIGSVAVATYLLADALDAVDAQVEELFGDQPNVPEGVKTSTNSGRGSGKGAGLHSSHKDSPSSHSGRGESL
jgi:hypothetical protein